MDEREFQQAMAALPEPPNGSTPPYWDYWRHDLWRRAQDDEAENFMGWPCVYHTMLVNHWIEQIDLEFQVLPHEYYIAIQAPAFGKPHDFYRNTSYSRNLIHQAYHLAQFSSLTALKFKKMKRVVEFGGGYGAMALVMRRLGFEGEYVIYDLPEFGLLQKMFLSKMGMESTYINSKAEFPEMEADMVIACYSLSETDFSERTHLLNLVRDTDSYLFLYSNRFAEYNNLDFFHMWARNNPEYQWSFTAIEHLPPESWYTYGTKIKKARS